MELLGLWEADAFRVMVVQDFESVAVEEDGDCSRNVPFGIFGCGAPHKPFLVND